MVLFKIRDQKQIKLFNLGNFTYTTSRVHFLCFFTVCPVVGTGFSNLRIQQRISSAGKKKNHTLLHTKDNATENVATTASR